MADTEVQPASGPAPAPPAPTPAAGPDFSGMTNDNEEAAKQQQSGPNDSAIGGGGSGEAAPPNPEAAKHSVTGAIFHGLLDVLGGKTETSYQRDPQTGKMVATETPKTPGQQWATLASSILAGAAAGAQTNKPGAQGLAGAAAGADAVMKKSGQQDQQKRQQATQDLDEQQKTDLQHAQMAKMNQDLTDKSWQASQSKIDAKFHEADRENEFTQRIKDAGAGARDLGVHRNADDLMETHKSDPSVMQAHLNGTLQSIPHVDENGKYDGVHYAVVPQEYLKQKTAADRTFRQMVPGKNPGDPPTIEKHTIPAGTMTNADADLAEHAAAGKTLDYQIGQQTEKQKSKDTQKLESMKEAAHTEQAKITAGTKGEHETVYAFNPQTNRTELTTRASADSRGLQAARKVGEGDISKDTHNTKVLNDIAVKANNLRDDVGKMKDTDWPDMAYATRYLSEHPGGTWNDYVDNGIATRMSVPAQNYVMDILSLRESSMGLQKVLTGSGRASETQIQALLKTLPGVERDPHLFHRKLDNFTQNIEMLRQGIPDLPGVPHVPLTPGPDTPARPGAPKPFDPKNEFVKAK